jgi:DNA modification methylase
MIESWLNKIHQGDALALMQSLPDESVDCIVTSPPYWNKRLYVDEEKEIGLEPTPDVYLDKLVELFSESLRVLKTEGSCWINIDDSYANAKGRTQSVPQTISGGVERGEPISARRDLKNAGYRDKDLLLIPQKLTIRLQEAGFYVRNVVIWCKNNPRPESVRDRATHAYEPIIHFTKSARYFYDYDAAAEKTINWGKRNRSGTKYGEERRALLGPSQAHDRAPMPSENPTRNGWDYWVFQTAQFKGNHFAVFPEEIPRRCISRSCPPDGVVLDPFMGSGTTALVARFLGRSYIGFELNEKYVEMANHRLRMPFDSVEIADTDLSDLPLFANNNGQV